MVEWAKQCLTCGGKLFEDKDWEKVVQIKNCSTEIANDIWNAAIEAVIEELDVIGHNTDRDIERIRKLKK